MTDDFEWRPVDENMCVSLMYDNDTQTNETNN